MPKNSAWNYVIPVVRVLAGIMAALLLAFIGDVASRVFNLLTGYPWPQEVHRHINFVGIGIAAGLGGYLGWINLNHPRLLKVGILMLVMAAGVVGVYLGRAYSPGVTQAYWWSRFATDSRVYLTGALTAVIIATAIGLIDLALASGRLKAPRHQPHTPVGPK